MGAKKKKSTKSVRFISDLSSSKELLSRNFSDLPRELKIHIFSFFTPKQLCKHLAPICREWWELSHDPALWKSLKIYVQWWEDTKQLALLLKRGSAMLRKLRIRTYFNPQFEELAIASYACPMLTHLDLRGCEWDVDSQFVSHFARNCPKIEELNLGGCNRVTKEAAPSIASLMHLRVLNLEGCHKLDDDCIKLIAEKCSRLEDLNILGVPPLTDKAIVHLGENVNSSLLRLAIGNYSFNSTDLALSSLSLCTKLQHLSLYGGQILDYWKMPNGLQSLKLDWTSVKSVVASVNFFADPSICNLVKLELSEININNDMVHEITKNCTLLETLSLSGCYRVTEVGLEYIVERCHNLRSLDLTDLHRIFGFCLYLVPENLSRLVYLNLECCKRIEKSILIDLARWMPKLEIIDVDGEVVVIPSFRKKRSVANSGKKTTNNKKKNMSTASLVYRYRKRYNMRSTKR